MSAIALTINWNGVPVNRNLMESMNRVVQYRCPDGAWIWVNGAVGLAQSDLATLPEDIPGVPIVVDSFRIVASCRIDNRLELLNRIPNVNKPNEATDTALILSAYQTWGKACVDYLIGDFAFIIWDEAGQTVYAARDISGVRPLFYYHDHNHLILASERTQILQNRVVSPTIDEEQLLNFLTPSYQFTGGWEQAFLKGVQVLPAGSYLLAQNGNVHVSSFWNWADHSPDFRTKEQFVEAYLDTLNEAVRCRLRSNGSVAFELSGGLDSPAIVALAARMKNQDKKHFHTFSLVFDDIVEVDERKRIQKILKKYPLNAHFVAADLLYKPIAFYPGNAAYTVLDPFELMMPYANFRLFDEVEQAGCRVVLTGYNGDGVNDGAPHVYYDLFRRKKWQEAKRRFVYEWGLSPKNGLTGLFFHGIFPFFPNFILRNGLMFRERRRETFNGLPAYMPTNIQKQVIEVDHAVRLKQLEKNMVRCPISRKVLLNLFPPTVSVTMPFPQPIEQRHPYSDRRLVELVLKMPASYKWEENVRGFYHAGRWHHRLAMKDILPNVVRQGNEGVNFNPVINHNFNQIIRKSWFLEHPVKHIFEKKYVHPDLFLNELDEMTDLTYLQAMLGLEAWFRMFESDAAWRMLLPV